MLGSGVFDELRGVERRIIIKLRVPAGERCKSKGVGEGKRIAEEGRLDFVITVLIGGVQDMAELYSNKNVSPFSDTYRRTHTISF